MADHSISMVTIASCRIRLMRGGSGAPLVFLHGGGGLGIWLPCMARLAKKFDVIAPEHPGFGESETPAWLDTIGDLANFYLDFLDQLDLEGVHLVGSSLGTQVAIAYAVDRLSREQAHLYILDDECDRAGAEMLFVTEEFDKTPVGKMIRSVKGFAAELEREKIRERTMRGMAAKLASGELEPTAGSVEHIALTIPG